MRVAYLLLVAMLCSAAWPHEVVAASTFSDPLIESADLGDYDNVYSMIEQGYYVDQRDDLGVTALMRAAYNGDYKIAKLLIDQGANVNSADVGGATPLHLAARNGHADVVKLLIDNDADIDAPDKEKWTPLMRAVASKQPEAVLALVKAGADANKANESGQTPITLSSKTSVPLIASYLTQGKASAGASNNDTKSAVPLYSNSTKSVTQTTSKDNVIMFKKEESTPWLAKKNNLTTPPTTVDQELKSSPSKYDSLLDSNQEQDKTMPIQLNENKDENGSAKLVNLKSVDGKKIDEPLSILDKNDKSVEVVAASDELAEDKIVKDKPQYTKKIFEQNKEFSTVAAGQDEPVIKIKSFVPAGSSSSIEAKKYYMQLGAFKNNDEALYIWKNLTNSNPKLFEGTKHSIITTTIAASNEKLYRLRLGPFDVKDKPDSICSKLRANNIVCFVVETEAKGDGYSDDQEQAINNDQPIDRTNLASNDEKEVAVYDRSSASYEQNTSQSPINSRDIEVAKEVENTPWRNAKAAPSDAKPASSSVIRFENTPSALPADTTDTRPQVNSTGSVDVDSSAKIRRYDSLSESASSQAKPKDLISADQNALDEKVRLMRRKEFLKANSLDLPEQVNSKGDFYQGLDASKAVPKSSEVQEAVAVDKTEYFKDRVSSATSVDGGPSQAESYVKLGSFSSIDLANDYWDRTFAYDQAYSHLKMTTQQDGANKASLKIWPVRKGEEITLCGIARAGGVGCQLYSSMSDNLKLPPALNAKVDAATVTGKNYWIDFGAFATTSASEYYWMFLQQDYANLMQGMQYHVEEQGKKGEGSYSVKLRSGPYNNSDLAWNSCSKLRSANIACIVSE